jgi:oligopeptide/dipeptide ABC transporter ATP-binding protein
MGEIPPAGTLLELRELRTCFLTPGHAVHALDGVSLRLAAGEILGLMGGSGCGKTVLALSVLRMVPHPGRTVSGEACFEGRDLLALSEAEMCKVRGRRIAMVMQDSLTALHPVFSVGEQIVEVVQRCRGLSRMAAQAVASQMLRTVGLDPPELWLAQRPHQLSGGMRQRVLLAMALSCKPTLLLADEPTTGLDVTVQAEVLAVLSQVRREQGMAILLITHDLKILAGMADRIAVMYGGQLVEDAPARSVLEEPKHPYSMALLAAAMRLAGEPIQGEDHPTPPAAQAAGTPAACVFAARCQHAFARCHAERPALREVTEGWRVACFLHHEFAVEELVRSVEERKG